MLKSLSRGFVAASFALAATAAFAQEMADPNARLRAAVGALMPAVVVVRGLAFDDMLNIRATASPTGLVIGRLQNGQSVRRYGCQKVGGYEWCKVEATDAAAMKGWAPGRYLGAGEATQAADAAPPQALPSPQAKQPAPAATGTVQVAAAEPAGAAGAQAFPEKAPAPKAAMPGQSLGFDERREAASVEASSKALSLALASPENPLAPAIYSPVPGGKARAPAEPAVPAAPAEAAPALAPSAPAPAPSAPTIAAPATPDVAAPVLAAPAIAAPALAAPAPAEPVLPPPVPAAPSSAAAGPASAAVQPVPTPRPQTEAAPAGGIVTLVRGEPAPATAPVADAAAFDATGEIPCARYVGQPMTRCAAAVARAGEGVAEVTVRWPDGGTRLIRFRAGKPEGANSRGEFRYTREADLNMIRIGKAERFEIPDALPFGD